MDNDQLFNFPSVQLKTIVDLLKRSLYFRQSLVDAALETLSWAFKAEKNLQVCDDLPQELAKIIKAKSENYRLHFKTAKEFLYCHPKFAEFILVNKILGPDCWIAPLQSIDIPREYLLCKLDKKQLCNIYWLVPEELENFTFKTEVRDSLIRVLEDILGQRTIRPLILMILQYSQENIPKMTVENPQKPLPKCL